MKGCAITSSKFSDEAHLQETGSDYGSEGLEHNVEDGLDGSDLASAKEADGDGRVDVAAANVADALSQGGNGQAEGQRDTHVVHDWDRPASDKDEEHGADQFGGESLGHALFILEIFHAEKV